ncbi:MAG: SpoIIE family protein phosphatase [Acidaminococcaceae bacterium]|nr:SpoIIE family protein phosphatase [Acidaminococcaceae bacterium]
MKTGIIEKIKRMKKMDNNIRNKLFLLLLSVSMVSFLLASLVLFTGLYMVRNTAEEAGQQVGNRISAFVQDFVEDQVKKKLEALVEEKSSRIDRELEVTAGDVRYLSRLATRILQQPQHYNPRNLPDPHDGPIRSGQVYLNYSDRLAAKVSRETFAHEAGLLANLAANFDDMDAYPAAYIGSTKGYIIAAELMPDKQDVKFTRKMLETYDPRETEWYKLGLEVKEPDFTDIYVNDSIGRRVASVVMPYYDARNNIAGVAGVDISSDDLFRQMNNLSMKDDRNFSDNTFILSDSGNILFSTRKSGILSVPEKEIDLRTVSEPTIAAVAKDMLEGQRSVDLVKVDGTEYYLAYAPVKTAEWSLGMLIPKSEVVGPTENVREAVLAQMQGYLHQLNSRFITILACLVVALLLFVLLLAWISGGVARQTVEPVIALENGVKEIARGNLDQKIEIQSEDEIGQLAESVNHMAVKLKEQMNNLSRVTAEKERIATELSVAAKIQAGMLPHVEPAFTGNPHYELYASMGPAKEVGGDFYDFYMLDEHRLAVTIADVSGKGVPAALFMAISKTILKSAVLTSEKASLARLVEKANRRICANNMEMMFVTAFIGVLDLRTGRMDAVNCGHNPPLAFYKATGRFEYLPLKKTGVVLGIDAEAAYREERLKLAHGDMLYLYTDGVTEAMDPEGRQYSEARLRDCLNRTGGSGTAKDILEAVQQDVAAFAGSAEQSDDITMVGLRYL